MVGEAIRGLGRVEIQQGKLITVTFAAGELTRDVATQLRRRVRGFVVLRSVPPAPGVSPSIVEDTTVAAPPDPERFIRLTASAATTATIWVI